MRYIRRARVCICARAHIRAAALHELRDREREFQFCNWSRSLWTYVPSLSCSWAAFCCTVLRRRQKIPSAPSRRAILLVERPPSIATLFADRPPSRRAIQLAEIPPSLSVTRIFRRCQTDDGNTSLKLSEQGRGTFDPSTRKPGP